MHVWLGSLIEHTQLFIVNSHSGPRTGNFNSSSCVSTQNDDEKHFVPPWQYEGKPKAAVKQLLDSATGAYDCLPVTQYTPSLADTLNATGKAVQMPASVRRQMSTGWLLSFWAISHEAGTKLCRTCQHAKQSARCCPTGPASASHIPTEALCDIWTGVLLTRYHWHMFRVSLQVRGGLRQPTRHALWDN